MKMNAPIKIEMKVYAVEEESGQQAVLTTSLPLGRYPTRATLESIFKQAQDALPEGFRVMDKSEFFNAYLQEEYGATEKFATPGSHEFTDEVIEMEPAND
ncbi:MULTISPECIES: hypothetical protein [unclassified Acinetobacter]|uniref:hypothetical protein n=1 Tax=unclassified Acinetobacter TaxID=196816 RepID=UPI0015D36E8F|nr:MULTISPECIES: hypothetical protein [unclassified Acinetobacter]